MTTTAGWAYTALSSQSLLMGYPERCSMDPDKMSTLGIAVGEQVRITHDENGRKGIATVIQSREESPETKVRMCKDGRRRWDDDGDKFDCELNSMVPHSSYTEAQAEANSDFIERLTETSTSHTKLVACAPHGGAMESYTDEQAERVQSQLDSASKDCSAWRCKGWRSGGGAFKAWHITSTAISRDSFPKLDQIGSRGFDYAVSFHGFSGTRTVYVGGRAPSALKNDIADAIGAVLPGNYTVSVVTSGPYAGQSEDNFVNWLTSSGDDGVQIEQTYDARSNYWQDIADAVADVFAALI